MSCEGCPSQASRGASEEDASVRTAVCKQLERVRHKVLVTSGKGGAGKSSIAAQLAWTLAAQGYKVGILDVDVCGPSIPRMTGVETREVLEADGCWQPVRAADNLVVMSIAFLLGERHDAVAWRGPRRSNMIKDFLVRTEWGALDLLLVDTPPGTGDELLTICEHLGFAGLDGALVVTTSQEIALLDVRKQVTFFHTAKVPVLGVVENLARFTCPCCQHTSAMFSDNDAGGIGGARQLASDMYVPLLGSIPLDPTLLKCCERGQGLVTAHPTSAAAQPLLDLAHQLLVAVPALRKQHGGGQA
jgi:Mrp family chromosome partitioning ATPase